VEPHPRPTDSHFTAGEHHGRNSHQPSSDDHVRTCSPLRPRRSGTWKHQHRPRIVAVMRARPADDTNSSHGDASCWSATTTGSLALHCQRPRERLPCEDIQRSWVYRMLLITA
jgi:hypothetical protein